MRACSSASLTLISSAALMGSITFGSTLCCSPIAGILVDKIGIRKTVFTGSVIAVVSLLISSFVSHQVSRIQAKSLSFKLFSTTDLCVVLDIRGYAWIWVVLDLFTFADNGWTLFQKKVWFDQWTCHLWQCRFHFTHVLLVRVPSGQCWGESVFLLYYLPGR